VQTPLAEVLAVIAEEAIAVLADPRPRSANHFLAVEASAAGANKESVSMSETRQRDLFYWAAVKPMYEGAVMHDAATDVDPVMGEAKTRRKEM
jgi:hypothetical protein